MRTIIVRYFEAVIDLVTQLKSSNLLGVETYEDIHEALIPGVPIPKAGNPPHPVFVTKCFSGVSNHRWKLVSVSGTASTLTHPAVFSVLLQSHDVSREVFLNQTLTKNPSQKSRQLLRQGTLVEVDYGFVQNTGRSDASTKANKRYTDTVLLAEMHKRRLAVVVKVLSENLIQVAPVTSRVPPAGDKSAFQIEEATIDKLTRYQQSGKPSFVLCGMLECVSVQRILPPLTYGTGSTVGRNVRYAAALSKAEEKLLKASLLHAVGASGYVPYNDLLQEQRKSAQLDEQVQELTEALRQRDERIKSYTAVESLAKGWAKNMGLDYESEVDFERQAEAEAEAAN